MGALALAALVSCSDEEDILPQQQEKIVSYLTRSHTPTLLSEQDAALELDVTLPISAVLLDFRQYDLPLYRRCL